MISAALMAEVPDISVSGYLAANAKIAYMTICPTDHTKRSWLRGSHPVA